VQAPRKRGTAKPAGGAQPDPMQTSLGYIGGDSFVRAGQRRTPGRKGRKG
jgi:23S rRNA pseudouridine2605 synthase